MRQLLLAVLFICAGISAAHATETSNVAFPPDGCSDAAPFMSFNGPVNGNNTYCSNGQFVLQNAIPNCADGQQVVKINGQFTCQTIVEVPSCSASEVLTHDATGYHCKPLQLPPSCADDEVLTYTGNGFACVKKTGPQHIPTCGDNQFLTYNGSTYQCASVTTPTIPNCTTNQVVKANGTSFYCADAPNAITVPECPTGTLFSQFGNIYCRPPGDPAPPAGGGDGGGGN